MLNKKDILYGDMGPCWNCGRPGVIASRAVITPGAAEDCRPVLNLPEELGGVQCRVSNSRGVGFSGRLFSDWEAV